MRVVVIPIALGNDLVPFQFGKTGAPGCDDPALDQRLQILAETRRSSREELGAMIELEAVLIARSQATANATRLFKYGYRVIIVQFTGDNQAGKTCTDDGNFRHWKSRTMSRETVAINVATKRIRKYLAEIIAP